ncbi:MAG: DNA/RNA non-specific endonuclease [Blastocatellia bacterium]|nr:DNA/RNA non-specific endonuclease [Blastocatellia bacterium]
MSRADLNRKASLKTMIRLGGEGLEGLERPGSEPETAPEEFEGRDGYDPSFLEGWEIALPLATGDAEKDMRMLKRGGSGVELKYTHFSVIMSVSRRLPMLTAVNIDGSDARRASRLPTWSFDGRLDKSDQWGDEIYAKNNLDRGHMVRREDPIWGSPDLATLANADTFHFTNSCPQMAGVNQVTWHGLEDYVLRNARADGMKVSVFTGPFFSDKDLEYRGALIPNAFWKVVAIVTEDGRPSATAYKVSQVRELEELEYVYAGYKTYQISVQQVIDATKINFSPLVEYDGFSQQERQQGEPMQERLDSLENIRI